jgi:peptidoglycan/xylan/chitin deacetylase (PgdA/CDA1 family)
MIQGFRDPRDRVAYSPISGRPRIRWPGDAPLAVWVSPNIEFYEFVPPPNDYYDMYPRVQHPDVQQYAYRDYGNRSGLWRMAQCLDDHSIRATVSLNVAVLEHLPDVREAIVSRGWAIMSHGIYNTRPIVHYDEDAERAFYRDTVETVRRHAGLELKGMLGPCAMSSTPRTQELMAEAGMTYHTDWRHDDQPTPIRLEGGGRFVSVPYGGAGQNDGDTLQVWTVEDLATFWKAQFDWLRREGAQHGGRVMCVALHPYAMGQPHAVDYLADTLGHMRGHDDVWFTTAEDIAAHYLEHHYDAQVAYEDGLPDNTRERTA